MAGGGSPASHLFHPTEIPWHLTPPTHHRGPTATWTALFPTQLRPHRLLSAAQTSNKTCFPLLTALCGCQSLCAKAWAPFWPRQGAPPPLGKGRGRQQWAGAGAGGWPGPGRALLAPIGYGPPNTRAPPHLPPSQSVPRPAAAAAPSLSRHPAAPCSGPAWRPRLRPPQMVSFAWGGGCRGLGILELRREDLGRF